jgi:hypothetical protein
MLHTDTSPEAAEILRERMRRMTPSQRIEEGARLCKFARHVMRAGIRKRHGDYSDDEVEMALARLLWGDDLYRKARPARPMTDELIGTLREIVSRLEVHGIPYMLVGSVAALAYGRSRSTPDFDVVVDAYPGTLRALLRSLSNQRFHVAEEAVIDMVTGWKVDLIPRKDRAFSETEFARRTRLEVLGVEMFVATIEDTIVAKLEWGQAGGGSQRQLEDVHELVKLGGKQLDRAYVERWVTALGLEDMWSRALAD